MSLLVAVRKFKVATQSVPLAIPELLPELNRLVFAYYGNMEHMFFAGDSDVADFVVLLCHSGLKILKMTLELWAEQERVVAQTITPYTRLAQMACKQLVIMGSMSYPAHKKCKKTKSNKSA